MERSSPVRTRSRPPGQWSIQSLRNITAFAPTGAAVGGRKRLMPSSLQTAVGITPGTKTHPKDEPAPAVPPAVQPLTIALHAIPSADVPAVDCRSCVRIGVALLACSDADRRTRLIVEREQFITIGHCASHAGGGLDV